MMRIRTSLRALLATATLAGLATMAAPAQAASTWRSTCRRGSGCVLCNTAPANCIRPYRHGVDSLYLSFPGSIDPLLAVGRGDAGIERVLHPREAEPEPATLFDARGVAVEGTREGAANGTVSDEADTKDG